VLEVSPHAGPGPPAWPGPARPEQPWPIPSSWRRAATAASFGVERRGGPGARLLLAQGSTGKGEGGREGGTKSEGERLGDLSSCGPGRPAWPGPAQPGQHGPLRAPGAARPLLRVSDLTAWRSWRRASESREGGGRQQRGQGGKEGARRVKVKSFHLHLLELPFTSHRAVL